MIRRLYTAAEEFLARPFGPGGPALWAFPLAYAAAFVWLDDRGTPGPWVGLLVVAVAVLAALVAASTRRLAGRWRTASAGVFWAWMIGSAGVAVWAVIAFARLAWDYFHADVWAMEGWTEYGQLPTLAWAATLLVVFAVAEVSARQAWRVASAVWDGRAFEPARQHEEQLVD